MSILKIENTRVYGWENAIPGMRNPKMSWDRSDTVFETENGVCTNIDIGDADFNLMFRLAKAGSEHAKYRRMISVWCDITAPQYWVAELDTYKVGTTRNSCSLQHKGTSRNYTLDDFTFDELPEGDFKDEYQNILNNMLDNLNAFRQNAIETKDYTYFRIMRQLMPMGYNYKFTWSANYEVLADIYRQRKDHPLVEWREFCSWIQELPCSEIITLGETTNETKD